MNPETAPIQLHLLPQSHPCLTVRKALELKGVDFEEVVLETGNHAAEVERIYGPGKTTVPGLMIGGDAVHGSTEILWRLDQDFPQSPLYPEPSSERIREAELWADRELQDLGRWLPFGALHFRPEAMGTFAGAGELDPAGTDFAIQFIRRSWKYHDLSAVKLADALAGLPGLINEIEGFARDGLVAGPEPTAADLQIGSTVRILLTVGDLDPLLKGTAAERIALEYFPDYPGSIPAGAFPADWVPQA